MRKISLLGLAVFTWTACTIGDGDVDWDGSIFDDAASDEDAGSVAADGGDASSSPDSSPDDAARPDSSVPDGGEPVLEPSDVAAVIARGRCGALKACLGEQLLSASFEGNDCVEYTTRQQADRHLHWLKDSVDASRVTFRPELLAACEADLIALGCDVTSMPSPDSCERAVEGKAKLDEDCTIDQDCEGSAWCDKGMQESCPGYCAPLQAEGMGCSASTQCASGLLCRGDVCTAQPSKGDACGAYLAPSACPPGLVCQGATELTCRSIGAVYVGKAGDSCDAFDALCEFGLVCQSQTQEDTTGRCVAKAASGGDCRRAQPNQCPADEYCKIAQSGEMDPVPPGMDGVCAKRPVAGEACGFEDCAPGSRCIGDESPICRPLKIAGEACEFDSECYGGLCFAEHCSVTTIACP
jgi:hypothetical protein